jgi:hypothetical protein
MACVVSVLYVDCVTMECRSTFHRNTIYIYICTYIYTYILKSYKRSNVNFYMPIYWNRRGVVCVFDQNPACILRIISNICTSRRQIMMYKKGEGRVKIKER